MSTSSTTPQTLSTLNILPPLTHRPPTQHLNDLLHKNHTDHNIFFSNELHNHMPHVLYSRHILGADDHRLDEEYHDEEEYLIPKRFKHGLVIDENNWMAHVGQSQCYGNFLEYFDRRLATTTTPTQITNLLTTHLYPHLLPNLVSGAVHPLIHIGFGIEFLNKDVIAEGLAEACVHQPSTSPILVLDNSKAVKGKTLEQIYEEIRRDGRFNSVVGFGDKNKTNAVLMRGAELCRGYAEQFWVD
ncbi:hypothetical protein HDV00_012194, partial [Rhizophlyctis rosea]